MNSNLTEIVCIVDRSGSMSSVREDAVAGFNSFLGDQKKQPGDANITLVLFNDGYEVVHDGRPIAGVDPLNDQTYVPDGCTALLDAVGRSIDDVGKRLAATPEDERPGKVIVAILTDGLENASTDYTRERVFEMISHQHETYSWEFIFLAANQDAIAEGGKIGIKSDNSMNFAASGEGTKEACLCMSDAVMGFRTTGKTGDWKKMHKRVPGSHRRSRSRTPSQGQTNGNNGQ